MSKEPPPPQNPLPVSLTELSRRHGIGQKTLEARWYELRKKGLSQAELMRRLTAPPRKPRTYGGLTSAEWNEIIKAKGLYLTGDVVDYMVRYNTKQRVREFGLPPRTLRQIFQRIEEKYGIELLSHCTAPFEDGS